MADLFSTLFRWAHRQDENFLTDGFVFIVNRLLTEEPETGHAFLQWLCFGSEEASGFEGPLRVTTQVTVREGRPDIWITGRDSLTLIEVKKDSGLGPDQLQRYRAILRKSGKTHQRLVLLTRYAVEFEEGVEPPERHVRWSEVADRMRCLETSCPITGFLIGQFLEFLSGLVMTIEAVTPEVIAGTIALRRLVNMLDKALELAKVPVHQARSGWDAVGYYLDKKHFWVGIEYKCPHLVSLGFIDASPDLDRFQSLGWGKTDGGFPYFGFDMRDETVGFLTLAADAQLAELTKFVEKAYKAAKDSLPLPAPASV